MTWTKKSLQNPAAVAVVVAIVLLLGIVTILRLPVQLFPDIERPQLNVFTSWRAASPQEVESELIEPIEDVLQGTPGLEVMQAWANPGSAWFNLQFGLSADMEATLLDVISRMNRIPPLPADADPPVINFGGSSNDTLIYYFVQVLPGNDRPVTDYSTFLQDTIIPRIEAVPGVANVDVNGGSDFTEELQVVFDPYRAAELGIDITNIAGSVGLANDVSGGFVDVGRRQFTLRFRGRYSPDQLSGMILDWRDGSPVTLGDVAEITVAPGRRNSFAYQNGNPAVGMWVQRESGANVLATLNAVEEVVEELKAGPLREQGITMEKSFNPAVFIKRAINLLSSNLLIGSLLAVGILWWFLRQGRATFLIAATIPISLLTTFVVLGLAGRTVNVISLAGLAFATGMVLDAAIVVLENIVRLREGGKDKESAAEIGATQVWGALLASTATTVAIFIPIIFLKDVEGQLFADLALTIAIGVSVSLVVAITVLPTAAKQWLKKLPQSDKQTRRWDRIATFIMGLTNRPNKRYFWIAGLMTVPLIVSYLLLPSMSYLPPVKRDAVDAFIGTPAGTTLETVEQEIAQPILARLQPYMNGEKEPALRNYYLTRWPGGQGLSLGVRAQDQGKIRELERIVREEILVDFPDVISFAQQGNLFGGFGSDGSIAIYLQSTDQEAVGQAAAQGVQLLQEAFPNSNTQANPDPQLTSPELQMAPNDQRIREVGWNRNQVASIVRAMGDGLWLGEHFNGDKRMDIILKSDRWESPEELESLPVSTPLGGIVPLGSLVSIERTVGPSAIQRVDGRRTTTLNFNPPEDISLQDAITKIKTEIEPQLRALLPADGTVLYGGSANSLDRAITSLGTNFIMALGLLFLLLSALFRSPKDALLVVISIPLATVGGVLALTVLNWVTFQPLDLLTMIGFIILLGLVVNNAILLVVQTRRSEEEGLSRADAVAMALRLRLRPIFMSTLTSIFGMMPLVLFPGAGSAIYRGMAATIVGGMSVSMIFTLILLPSLLQLGAGARKPIRTRPELAAAAAE